MSHLNGKIALVTGTAGEFGLGRVIAVRLAKEGADVVEKPYNLEAIKKAQPTDSAAIAAALAEIKDFDTILGKFSFNAVGDAVYDPVVLIVKNGKFEVFE